MKTFLQFIITLTSLLVGAFFTNDRTPDAALVVAGIVAASLTAWTLQQYQRRFAPLTRFSRLRLRLVDARHEPPARPLRLAA